MYDIIRGHFLKRKYTPMWQWAPSKRWRSQIPRVAIQGLRHMFLQWATKCEINRARGEWAKPQPHRLTSILAIEFLFVFAIGCNRSAPLHSNTFAQSGALHRTHSPLSSNTNRQSGKVKCCYQSLLTSYSLQGLINSATPSGKKKWYGPVPSLIAGAFGVS